jgi:hypothetical protein
MNHIIMTPINLVSKTLTSNGKKARSDYLREKNFEENGNNPKWDDSKLNNAIIGDYFAFVHQKENRVEIYKIESIALANTRPNYWDLPDHQQRNVIHLSSFVKEMTWVEMKNIIGYKDAFLLRGTQRSKKSVSL